MESDSIDDILRRIGILLARDLEYPLDDTLLIAQVDGAVAPLIFKNRGNHVLSRWPDLRDLGDALLDLWYANKKEDRWLDVEYLIRDGRFHVRYVYPDEIDPDVDRWDRREETVRRYFGDKPIVQPDWPPPGWEDFDDLEA